MQTPHKFEKGEELLFDQFLLPLPDGVSVTREPNNKIVVSFTGVAMNMKSRPDGVIIFEPMSSADIEAMAEKLQSDVDAIRQQLDSNFQQMHEQIESGFRPTIEFAIQSGNKDLELRMKSLVGDQLQSLEERKRVALSQLQEDFSKQMESISKQLAKVRGEIKV